MSVSSLQKLPAEVLFGISDLVDLDDRKNLSLVNSGLRLAMAPCLFKVLRVNCPLVEDHILPTIVTKHGAHVLELRLDVTFYPNEMKEKEEEEEEEEAEMEEEGEEDGEDDADGDQASDMDVSENGGNNDDESNDDASEDENEEEEEEEEEESDAESDSGPKWYWTDPPASVWARQEADISIVHDLIQFKNLPRCRTLTLYTNGEKGFEMEADWDDNDIGNNYMYFCCEPENWDEVKAKEQKYPWRAALRDMYHDIATLSRVEDLRILNFLPRKTSFWQKDAWAAFLGRLKKLTLYPYGGNNGDAWSVNTLPGFHGFFNDLPNTMLAHTNNLEYFKISAHEEGFLGGSGSLYIAPGSMPALRSLHVDGIAAPSVLTSFLQEGGDKLSKICIAECVALDEDITDEDPVDQPTWEDLWKAVRHAIKAPAEIIYVPTKKRPVTEEEANYDEDDPYQPPADEDEKIKKYREKEQRRDGFCIWPYAWVDGKYGGIWHNWEKNLARLEGGEDNLEFNLLMEEVQRGGGKCTVS